MKSLKLKNDIYWIGSLDPDLRVFDIIMETEFGTTYNSYFVKGSEKTAVVETVKIKCFDEYLEKLSQLTDISKLDYIVVNHTEPDHAGAVAKLLEIAKNAKVVGSEAAVRFLKGITNIHFEYIEIENTRTISLGDKTLNFISAPFLHWPDSIYTYVEEDKILFSCDSFGSHYSFDEVLYSKVKNSENYMSALKYYYTAIFSPFKDHVLSAIKKIENLDIDMICTGHGPILDKDPFEIVNIYKEWSTDKKKSKKSVIIPYVSAYGYTEEIALKIKEGITKNRDISVTLHDMVSADPDKVFEDLYFADGILFGTPTINGDALKPIWDIVTALSPIVHAGKVASAFGSYGWSGEGVPNIVSRLDQLRMKVIEGYSINFKGSDKELEGALEFGRKFAAAVTSGEVPLRNESSTDISSLNPDGVPKKWRCVVCGEIYEGVLPPQTCPACGVGYEFFELYEPENVTYSSDRPEKIVIVGASAAGVSAAQAIRERNKGCSVEIITSENIPGYYRPSVSKDFANPLSDSDFYLKSKEWYKNNNITLTLSSIVESISSDENKIYLKNGESRNYDKLIIATGSRNFVPPYENVDYKGVFTFRTADDADKIRKYAKGKKRVLVVGGGVLGLEIAEQLKACSLETTVMERASRLMPRQLDQGASELIKQDLEKFGIKVIVDDCIKLISGDEKVERIITSRDKVIETDMVVVAIGVKSNSELAKDVNADVNRGIVVDNMMRTTVNNIYAAGDAAEYNGRVYALWQVALEQGKVAGANAVGDNVKYVEKIQPVTFSTNEIELFSVGDIGSDESKEYREILFDGSLLNEYKKLYFVDNKLVGGILLGDTSAAFSLMKSVTIAAAPDQVAKLIF